MLPVVVAKKLIYYQLSSIFSLKRGLNLKKKQKNKNCYQNKYNSCQHQHSKKNAQHDIVI